MILNPYVFGSASSGYLDGLSPLPRAAHSLRKMISTATNAVRVRRSSDNAEQDIGFTGNALDTTSLATFVGANSAFAVTWYDQTGNGYNQVQATASKQPRIVNAGVYDGKLVYDGTDDSMSVASLPFATPHAAVYVKAKIEDQTPTAIAYETSTNYTSNTGAFIIYMDGLLFGVGIRGSAANWRRDFNPTSQTVLRQTSFLLQTAVADGTTAQQRMWETGVPLTATATVGTAVTPVQNFSAQTMYCGARAGTSLYLPMWEETKAIYDADTTSIRASIEAIVA
jgi:hypothetical protein